MIIPNINFRSFPLVWWFDKPVANNLTITRFSLVFGSKKSHEKRKSASNWPNLKTVFQYYLRVWLLPFYLKILEQNGFMARRLVLFFEEAMLLMYWRARVRNVRSRCGPTQICGNARYKHVESEEWKVHPTCIRQIPLRMSGISRGTVTFFVILFTIAGKGRSIIRCFLPTWPMSAGPTP